MFGEKGLMSLMERPVKRGIWDLSFRSAVATLAILFLMVPMMAAQAPTPLVRQLGTVQSISGQNLVLKTDAGAEAKVQIQATTKIVRLEPGQTDLKSAAAAAVEDIQAGDRLLARGQNGADGTLMASSIVLMKASSIAQKREQERLDWQRRGTGGMVKSVDTDKGEIVISAGAGAPVKSITLKTSKQTIFRRYSPGSVKFEDAKASSIAEVAPNDQLRVRGTKNSDGSEWTADEIVSGSFRNISGTVVSTDAAQGTVTVMDLVAKKPVTVSVTGDSMVRQLPPQVAMMLAARLKGIPMGQPGQGPGAGAPSQQGQTPQGAQGGAPAAQGAAGGGARAGGGRGDLQTMLSRLPAVPVAELQKGAAVLVVATQGSDTQKPVAITMLTGVEPILTASPNSASASSLLSPWSIGGGGGGGEEGGPQ